MTQPVPSLPFEPPQEVTDLLNGAEVERETGRHYIGLEKPQVEHVDETEADYNQSDEDWN